MQEYYELIILGFSFGAGMGMFYFIQNLFSKKRDSAEQEERNLVASSSKRVVKSKNSFISFYGLKIKLDPDNTVEIEACAQGKDMRCIRAKDVGLQTYCDCLTNGEDCFLYIGVKLGALGLEGSDYIGIDYKELTPIMIEVNEKILSLALPESPSLHLQAIYEY